MVPLKVLRHISRACGLLLLCLLAAATALIGQTAPYTVNVGNLAHSITVTLTME